jgi:hypothetical protein
MITFIPKDAANKTPTFSDVPINQFFVYGKCLYQKVIQNRANQLTNSENLPFSDTNIIFNSTDEVDKIVLIDRIEY